MWITICANYSLFALFPDLLRTLHVSQSTSGNAKCRVMYGPLRLNWPVCGSPKRIIWQTWRSRFHRGTQLPRAGDRKSSICTWNWAWGPSLLVNHCQTCLPKSSDRCLLCSNGGWRRRQHVEVVHPFPTVCSVYLQQWVHARNSFKQCLPRGWCVAHPAPA